MNDASHAGQAPVDPGDLADADGWSPVWEQDFDATVRSACSQSHDVLRGDDDDLWVMALGPDPLAGQGWKLHVSATVAAAGGVLDVVLPVLRRHQASFKAIRRPSDLQALNSGFFGNSQVGKFVAVYPTDDAMAVTLARELSAATARMAGPAVPSDIAIPGGLVFYRFGAFEARTVRLASGAIHPAVMGPDGELVPDIRSRRRARPAWTDDPFVADGLVDGDEVDHSLVGGRFLQVSPMSRSARGEVWLGVDLHGGLPVVIKSARRHSAASSSGRDAFDRMLVEGQLLELLDGTGAAPDHVTTVVEEHLAAVVMERVDGRSLDDVLGDGVLAGTLPEPERIVTWLRGLVDALTRLHQAGWTYRDLKTGNVLISDDRAVLIDFDLAARIGDTSEDAMGGSRGYMPPEMSQRHAASAAADVYALGAVLFSLLTGAEPSLAPDRTDLLTRPIRLLAPAADRVLAELCASCLSPVASDRPSVSEIRALCDAWTPDASRTGGAGPIPPTGGTDAANAASALARRLIDTLAESDPEEWGKPLATLGKEPILDVYSGVAGVVLVLADAVRALGVPRHRSRCPAPGRPAAAGPVHRGRADVAAALAGAADPSCLDRAALDLVPGARTDRPVPPRSSACRGRAGVGARRRHHPWRRWSRLGAHRHARRHRAALVSRRSRDRTGPGAGCAPHFGRRSVVRGGRSWRRSGDGCVAGDGSDGLPRSGRQHVEPAASGSGLGCRSRFPTRRTPGCFRRTCWRMAAGCGAEVITPSRRPPGS